METALFLIFLQFQVHAQLLTSSQKKEWRKELKAMEHTDQYYRKMMVDSPELENDSIWKLQTALDSINKVNFIVLTQRYGYPSQKNIGREASIGLILHFTNEHDFHTLKELFKAELEKGNMLPEYYAWWFDRCQRNMDKPIYFGPYTNDEFCGETLRLYNERRREIGLKELEGKITCED